MKEPLKVILKGMVVVDADGLECMIMEPVTYRGIDSAQLHIIEKTVIGGLVALGDPALAAAVSKSPNKA